MEEQDFHFFGLTKFPNFLLTFPVFSRLSQYFWQISRDRFFSSFNVAWPFQPEQNSLTFPWLENALQFFQAFQGPWRRFLGKTILYGAKISGKHKRSWYFVALFNVQTWKRCMYAICIRMCMFCAPVFQTIVVTLFFYITQWVTMEMYLPLLWISLHYHLSENDKKLIELDVFYEWVLSVSSDLDDNSKQYLRGN